MDLRKLTPAGQALKELGIEMIPAYSPQARGEASSGLGPGRDGCCRNCAWQATPTLRKRTASCCGGTFRRWTGTLECRPSSRGGSFVPVASYEAYGKDEFLAFSSNLQIL